MKKLLTIMLAICGLLCFAVGCGESPHEHAFIQKVATETFIAFDATCTTKAKYYYSCECGAKEALTFEFGEVLEHSFIDYDYDNNATCTEDGTETATCERVGCNEKHTRTQNNTALKHNYGIPVYTWNGDKCTATRLCANDSTHKETETVTAVYMKDTDATCLFAEKGHYIATFENSAFTTQQTEENSFIKGEALDHSFDEPTYSWNNDKCTATRICSRDNTHVETETVTAVYIKDTDATCLFAETGHYKATFNNSAFVMQATEENSFIKGEALDHSFDEPTYSWNNDKCTATRVCSRDDAHVETETVTAVYIKDTDATCTTAEKGHYIATFENSAFTTQQTEENSFTLISYTIDYNLEGGLATNNTTYTIETDTFTLVNPTRKGYEFTGWTGTGLDAKTMTVTISKGSLGERSYDANWEIIEYAITYNLDGGNASENPAIYTVEDVVTLNNPTRKGYTFVGWSGSDITGLSMNVTISKGTIEPKEYIANWEIIEYTIGYNLDGGTVIGNPITYTVENTITLKNPVKTGYTFTGWSGTDLSGKTMTVIIAKGTINPRQYVANWEANSYILTFEANGGTVTPNSTTVTFDSSYDIPTPFKTGHDFNGWYFGDKLYDGGEWKDTNNITVTAKWTPHIYTVTLGLNGGNCETDELKIAYNSDYAIPTPKYFGYDWLGWYKDGAVFEQTTGIWTFAEDIHLVAQWQKQDKIKISTADDLNMVAYDMSAHYILVNNIDLQSVEWSMIGDAANPFKGVFDGQGFTISNLKVSKTADNVGLFGVNEGIIKNLSIENASISSGTISGGVLVGQNSGMIENCSTSGVVTNSRPGAYVGGFIGFADENSNASNCSTDVNIICDQSSQTTYALYVGGFVGKATQVSFVNCVSTGLININISYAGEFSTSGSFSLSHKLYAGGFVGNSSYSNYEQCYASNTLECMIGNGRDKNSYNDSRLTNDQKHYAYLYCGGFGGYIDSDSLNNCYSLTQIKSETKIHSPYRSYYSSGAYASTEYSSDIYAYSYIGGLVGYSVYVNVENSYSVYDINAYTCASTRFANTYGENTTYAYSYIGGIVGYFNGGNIVNSFSSSNGLNILCESITIDNYWTNAYLTNVSSAIIGYVKTEGTATNNYYVSEQEENDTHGTRTTLINLQSASFVQNILGWDTNIWELKNGSFPTLKE